MFQREREGSSTSAQTIRMPQLIKKVPKLHFPAFPYRKKENRPPLISPLLFSPPPISKPSSNSKVPHHNHGNIIIPNAHHSVFPPYNSANATTATATPTTPELHPIALAEPLKGTIGADVTVALVLGVVEAGFGATETEVGTWG